MRRPPLILRDIQAVSPATYEYGGTVPAFRFFSRHEVSESAHSVHFIFLSFFICFFLGIMPFSTPLSFIFLFLFCPSFSAGFPNPLIPFACGKRTESLSGCTLLLCLFVYCFSFGCLFFRKFSKPFRLLAGWRIRLCLLRDDGLIRRTSGRRMTDKASFFLFSRKIRYRVRGKYKGIRRDKKWCEAECRRII